MCPDHQRTIRMATIRFEVAVQSAFQEKFSYAIAIRYLLFGGSVMVRRMRAFAVANEMGRGFVSVAVAAIFPSSAAASLPGMFICPGTQMRRGRPFLFSSRCRID